jgi:hypothetical protein
VVVLVGLTVWLPDAETLPMPWSMLTVVAPVVLQERVEELPVVMLTGLAVKDPIEGGEGAVTVTVQLAVTLPPALVAVRV